MNVVTADFSESRLVYTCPLYQYDYGQILKIKGVELPDSYEVHFANTDKTGESVTQIGSADGVSIPDSLLLTWLPVFAWVFLHTAADDGETEYKAVINVKGRAQPSDEVPTPVEQSAITQAIAALNNGVTRSEAAAESASASAESASQSATEAAESASMAAVDAQSASTASQIAQTAAQTATQQATAAESAKDAAQTAADRAAEKADSITGLTAEAETLPAGSAATAEYSEGVLTLGIPQGAKGDKGEQGERGEQGAQGIQGEPGAAGVSPTVTITPIAGGHRITITDAEGEHSADVMDGTGAVTDVQVNGTSVLNDGVARDAGEG